MFVLHVNDFWKFLLIFFLKKSGFAFLEILQKKQKFLRLSDKSYQTEIWYTRICSICNIYWNYNSDMY